MSGASNSPVGFFGLFIIIAIIVVGFKSCFGDKEAYAKKRCKDTSMAFIMSQKFVKRDLKSPSSAKFPARPASATSVGECSISILSSFEAQNSFGAMLRGGYKVTMHYNKDSDTWYATDLIIEQ